MIHMCIRSAVLITLSLTVSFPVYAQDNAGESYSFEATVERTASAPCSDETSGCTEVTISGDDEETITILTDPRDALGGQVTEYREGMTVIVQTQEAGGERVYFISDVVRRTPLVWLGLLFIVAVFLFGGISALRAFLGMVVSFGVLLGFILPRILAGDPPVIVALIGSFVIMGITFLVCHGRNRKTLAAFAGTGASLIVTALLAGGFSVYAMLGGTADEEVLFLMTDFPDLNTRGVLLAGIIIGTLGVLDDITISQASAVFELRRANPAMKLGELYRSAHRIGADHIAAAVNTLILAYAGTALPLLLLLVGVPSGESWFTFINREMIAEEIVRTLVGSIGLLAAVPLTTLIASYLALNSDKPDTGGKRHVHHHAH